MLDLNKRDEKRLNLSWAAKSWKTQNFKGGVKDVKERDGDGEGEEERNEIRADVKGQNSIWKQK